MPEPDAVDDSTQLESPVIVTRFKYKDERGEWRKVVRTLRAQGQSEAKRELAERGSSSRRGTSAG